MCIIDEKLFNGVMNLQVDFDSVAKIIVNAFNNGLDGLDLKISYEVSTVRTNVNVLVISAGTGRNDVCTHTLNIYSDGKIYCDLIDDGVS